MKKNAKRNWATAQLSCENFFFCIATLQLYCNLAIVLQERGLEKKNCIAREGCSWRHCIESQGIVLQPWECSWLGKLYCNLGSVVGLENCIARGDLLAR